MVKLPIVSLLDDIAEAIAEPPSRRPFAEAVGKAGRVICDRRSANPAAQGYGGPLGAAVDAMCGPYWDEQAYSPPVAAPPFSGGQCPVNYLVDSRYKNAATANNYQSLGPSVVLGPVTGMVARPNFFNASKVDLWITSGAPGNPDVRVVTDTFTTGLAFNITGVVRQDSGVDNCGDPPPELSPGPTPAPDPGPPAPGTDAEDDPVVGPVLPVPDLPDNPGSPGLPVPRFPFSPPTGPSFPPGDTGTPAPPVLTDPGPGGEGGGSVEGEAPPGSELVGLRLNLAVAPARPREYGDGIYVGAAYVRMGTAQGLDQDLGGVRILPGQFFFAEVPGLTRWRVDATLGYIWEVTPYYREAI